MAVQIVKNPPRPWGNVIAQSLGSTLSQLAEAKVNKMKSHEDMKLLTSIGVDPLSARFINSLPAKQRGEEVGNYLRQLQAEKQRRSQQESSAPQTGYQEQSPLQQILSPQPSEQPAQERPGLPNLFNQGTTGSGINPQFLQALQPEQQMAPQQVPEQPQMPEQDMRQQQAVAPQESIDTQPHDILARSLGTGKGSQKTAAQELQEQRRIDAEQKSLRPFIDKEQQKYDIQQELGELADEALEILHEHHKDFPGAFKGNLSQKQLALLERNPYVRRYNSILNRIVIKSGQEGKGLPSKHRLTLEALAKTDLNQPLKTQERNLESLREHRDESTDRWKFILSQNKSGDYPKDIQSRVVQYDMAMRNPLQHPASFEENTLYEQKGQKFKIINGEWKKV